MHKLSACELRDKFRSGDLTAEAIATHFLDRIDRHNESLGAFVAVFRDRALEQARALDKKRAAGEPIGRMAGVPVALKDNMHVEGELTTCASKFLTNYRAPFASTVARLLEAEDAIIVGKTNLDEFAMGSSNENSSLGLCRNPWDTTCIPGGSSGGSAAAVAARLVPLALGSDTGGSIRQPAALTGIHGFKPTYGRVSRFGLVAFGSSLDQIGPFAHNSEDIGLIMEVIGQHCDRDSTSLAVDAEKYPAKTSGDLKGMTFGVPQQFIKDLEGEPRATFERTLDTLRELGAKTVDVDLDILKYSIAVYYILATAEASTNLARFDGVRYGQRSERAETLDQVYDYSKAEGFGPEVKRRILLGTYVLSAGYQDAYYKKAQKVRTLMIDAYKAAFRECDMIAMPTVTRPAFPIGAVKDPLEMYLEDIYTIGANLGGLPAISTPAGFIDGKPIGMQLVGPQKADVAVCTAAMTFANAAGLEAKIPESFID